MDSPFKKFQAAAYKLLHGVSNAPEISVEELKALLDAGEELQLLDVREAWEHEAAALPGARLIPLMELPQRASELDKSKPVVAYCHVGGRSARATAFLRKSGFSRALNLAGGIDAWSERIDPSVPRY